MAPTICSGKKPQTRIIATTTNIRRHGQASHQLNQALSNIVNFVGKNSLNPKVTAALRLQNSHNQTERNTTEPTTGNYRATNRDAYLNQNRLTHTNNATAASNHHRQQISAVSDNAVTSLTLSDTGHLFDLRLANEILNNDSAATDDSNTTDTSSSSSSSSSSSLSLSEATSLSSLKEKTSSPTSECQESSFQRFSAIRTDHDKDDDSENEATNLYDNENRNELNSNIKIRKNYLSHPNNERKYYFSCNDVEWEEDELEHTREFNSDMSAVGSDTDMETDESDSMTSFDTEKSAELKKGNHPLLRDGLIAAEQLYSSSSSNKKSSGNTRNTDGLLSIAVKTIKLVKRNQLLQQRLMQLQQETSEFIQSVLANPENKHFREKTKQKV